MNRCYDKHRQCAKKQKHHLADKGPYSQGYGLPSSHVWMWELNNKEGRALKNWCFWTVMLEETPESPLESKEIKPVNLKGNQPQILFGRIEAEAEDLIFWPPDANGWGWRRPWFWVRLKAEGEEGDREWDGWMASSIQWAWTWANSRR